MLNYCIIAARAFLTFALSLVKITTTRSLAESHNTCSTVTLPLHIIATVFFSLSFRVSSAMMSSSYTHIANVRSMAICINVSLSWSCSIIFMMFFSNSHLLD